MPKLKLYLQLIRNQRQPKMLKIAVRIKLVSQMNNSKKSSISKSSKRPLSNYPTNSS